MASRTFVHDRFTSGAAQIRLIELLPKTLTEPLDGLPTADSPTVSCKISHVELENSPPYVALSYVWGDASRCVPILINKSIFYATQSLATMLRHLTPSDKPLTAWVDALCINQDEEEKSEQVQQIPQIYSQATEVLCWLGEAADDSDDALRWVREFGSRAFELGIGSTPTLRLVNLLREFHDNAGRALQPDMKDFLTNIVQQFTSWRPGDSGPITALHHLFKRPYWSRMWVVQEVVKGQSVKFLCGDSTMNDRHLHHTLRLIRNFGQYQVLEAVTIDKLIGSRKNSTGGICQISTHNPINLLKLRNAKGPYELTYLVRSLRHFEATDPRDRIFSVISFASDAADFDIRPDYGMSYTEVYIRTTMALIARAHLEILTLCVGLGVDEDGTLPSWVPDFSRPLRRTPLQGRALVRRRNPVQSRLQPSYLASRLERNRFSFHRHPGTGTDCLSLDAVCVGKIGDVGGVWESSSDETGTWLKEIETLSRTMFEDDAAHRKAVYRTAVADQQRRSGEDKPRLSTNTVEKVASDLKDRDLADVDAKALNQLGLADYAYEIQLIARDRRPFSADGKLFGLGPMQTRPGDLIYVIYGANIPFILRPNDDTTLSLVGEAYVHGVMDGEALGGKPECVRIQII
ncbi:heterokaryon incompatibility protein-domain-containing protein [Xylariaceae sp. FL1272]|nr:heterokaryon incompatibility protein-domain-containing protein [Xylariaceae sp. FL1272]